MIRSEPHGDVTRFELTGWRSRLVGFSVSTYLVRGALIDCGYAAVRSDVAALMAKVRPEGVVITHRHEDHAGNAELVARLGIPVLTSQATERAIRAPGGIGLYRHWTWGAMPPLRAPLETFVPNDLRLVETPGHSDDHHVVWDEETGTLFSGDLFLGVRVRIYHPGEDPRVLVRSLRRAAALSPDRMFDGHRGLVPTPIAALTAKADWMDETIAAIDGRIAEGWSDSAILRGVLGGEEWGGVFSLGDYSRANFVRSVRKSRS